MYTRVFVIISVSVAPANIWSTCAALLAAHEADGSNQTLEARFDRLSGLPGRLSDHEAAGLLPARDKRVLHNRIAFVRNLSPDDVPAALVMPSGAWHGTVDYGWTMMGDEHVNARAEGAWREFFFQTMKNHCNDYIVETWVHS